MNAVVAVITNLRMDLFEALVAMQRDGECPDVVTQMSRPQLRPAARGDLL